jgi:teichuronic acid exporter
VRAEHIPAPVERAHIYPSVSAGAEPGRDVRRLLLSGLITLYHRERMNGFISPKTEAAPQPDPGLATGPRVIDTKGLSLRAFAAKGLIVNTAFDLGLTGLGLVRGLLLAALLTRADYGLWGVLVVSIGVLAQLKVIGIGDKFIQQQESDQESEFQKAFTLELLVTAIAIVPLAAALPVIAVVYGHWKLVPPGAVLISVMLAYALQSPFWIFYRSMDFVRQRALASVEPLIAFIVTVTLALLGFGYWSLAIGLTAGAWSGAAIAIWKSPYRLRIRFDRRSTRIYASFSGPVLISTVCSILLANSTAIVLNAHLGLAGVGAIALASNITAFTTKVDDLVGETLYPAICAIQDRMDLLRESFIKTNRLALMWAMPFGAGVALFGGDLIHFVIGRKWDSAIVLLQVTGITAAVAHIGWNWDDYLRARSNTKPMAVGSVSSTIVFALFLPLVFVDGLDGLAIAIGAQALVFLVFRAWYMTRLFEGFRFVRHASRAALPTLPGLAIVLIGRYFESSPRSPAMAAGELCVFGIVTAAATWIIEGDLIREAIGYLLARARRPPSAPTEPNLAV